MNIDFKTLELIPHIMATVAQIRAAIEANTIEKRWLGKDELLEYLPYKIDSINSKIKANEFIRDIHYYKKGRTLIFDKVEIDKWVMNKRIANNGLYQGDDIAQFINDFAV